MLTLTLVRHAKSSWDEIGVSDSERPLNQRGKNQTGLMGDYLEKQKVKPDLILCSTARRARQTLIRLMRNWSTEAEISHDDRLYMASANDFPVLLEEYGKGRKHLMLVGHNPGLHMLAYSLAQKGGKEELKALAEKFPTLAISSLKLAGGKWKNLTKGELDFYVTPKLLTP